MNKEHEILGGDGATFLKRIHKLGRTDNRDAELGMQEVTPIKGDIKETPIVLLHGATFGSPMFDLPVPGYSLQEYLALQGWRNYALDIRGYGRSLPSATLESPAQENAPYARLDDAVMDLAAGIKFVLEDTGCERVNLLAFSWGTVVASAYAANVSEFLQSQILYAPLYGQVNDIWIDRIADPKNRAVVNPDLGCYRWVQEADIRARWDADIPDDMNVDDYREAHILPTLAKALASAGNTAGQEALEGFKAPCGALMDLFEIFNGRPLYDPKRIDIPTLIVRGCDDTTSTQSDALQLYNALKTKKKRLMTISPGSHFLCIERNAMDLFDEIDLFFKQNSP